MPQQLRDFIAGVQGATLTRETGRVVECNGLVLEASGPNMHLGELCHVCPQDSLAPVSCEVVGFRPDRLLLMPYGPIHGISRGSRVMRAHSAFEVPCGPGLLGRVVDAFGEPLDDLGPLSGMVRCPLRRTPVNPLHRKPITEVMETGVRAIDCLLTLGKGQRMGVFAGSGVGKSTLLGMMARSISADVNVIALIGERGREVWDFIHGSLGEEGLKNSVIVVATADQPALVRTLAVHSATVIAEAFRDAGKDVLLIMDSITRFAMARREVGLAAGEPATTRGYTPSVFSLLPQVLERCGNFDSGSITAVYSVLVEGDDMNEPVADHMRALLDGHIVLSRELATRGHYPPIDVTHSISRLLPSLASVAELALARRALGMVARVEGAKDLIDMGAYHAGSNAELDSALSHMDAIMDVLAQNPGDSMPRAEAIVSLAAATDMGAAGG